MAGLSTLLTACVTRGLPGLRRARYDGAMGLFRAAGIAAVLLVAAACTRPSERHEYTLDGQVLAIQQADARVVIRHQDIKGFMPGMTMPFPVKDRALLSAARAGDFVSATLVVGDGDAWLSQITPTGRHEAVPADAVVPRAMEPPLTEGQPVPDAALVDQAGRAFSPAAFRGRPWAVTFVYTRCPLANFCPTLERKFLSVQAAVRATRRSPARASWPSPSIRHTTLRTCSPHMPRRSGPTPAIWTFVTGPIAAVEHFSERFGVVVQRGNGTPEEFVHSMRTAVVGGDGRVAAVFEGSEWAPASIVDALGRAGQAR